MPFKEIANDAEFARELASAGAGRLVVVDFFAVWCGPCTQIAPFFKQLSSTFPQALFLKVDVDKCDQVAQANRVTAMPTFIFFKNSREIERIRGGNKQELEEKVRQHAAASTAEAGGEAGATETGAANGFMDLNAMINKAQCECLNQSDDHTWENVLNTSPSVVLKSDCDEQLILFISFNQTVKLHSIVIQGPQDNGPKTVKLFMNQTRTLDFDSAESMEPAQLLELKPEDIKDNTAVNLRYVKFQNVQNITLFFPNNQSGSDCTHISNIKFIGTPVNVTNMNEFKRVAGQAGEAHG